MEWTEKELEKYFRQTIEKMGGKCWKFTSPSQKGVPDRIVLLPGGVMAFVEFKSPGQKLSPIQAKIQKEITALGLIACVADSRGAADALIMFLKTMVKRREV